MEPWHPAGDWCAGIRACMSVASTRKSAGALELYLTRNYHHASNHIRLTPLKNAALQAGMPALQW